MDKSEILQIVSEKLNIDQADILRGTKISGARKQEVVWARQLCIAFSREVNPQESLKVTGDYFGRDHATVIHSIRVVQNERQTSRKREKQYLEIKEIINGMIEMEQINYNYPVETLGIDIEKWYSKNEVI
jgi:chromosomal replication initiation ATPase DnaA